MGAKTRRSWAVALAAIGCLAAGCEVSKSANPLSPAIAGPIEGVTISQPAALEPGQGWQIYMRDQPIKLLFSNANTSGQRPVTYTIEIASDANFSTIVFKRTGIAPAQGPTTRVQLPDALTTGRTYWWHVRAEDGANSSVFSDAKSFVAVAPVVLGAPVPSKPVGAITDTTDPAFAITAGPRSGPVGHVVYTLQIGNDQAFTSLVAQIMFDETPPVTQTAPYGLFNNRTYYWRVIARDVTENQATSPWSITATFTIAKPAPPPPPPSGGGGGGSTGNWQACAALVRPAGSDQTPVVQCVRDNVYHSSTLEDAFSVTKHVAWLLRGQGTGLLFKDGGENIIYWQGKWFSISRVCYPDGHLYKILSDAGPGGTNGAGWADDGFVDPRRYVPSINPDLP
jgi:hypothetical protein